MFWKKDTIESLARRKDALKAAGRLDRARRLQRKYVRLVQKTHYDEAVRQVKRAASESGVSAKDKAVEWLADDQIGRRTQAALFLGGRR